MHIKILNQNQIEMLKSIKSHFGKYKLLKKILYEMEYILRYRRKTDNDYITIFLKSVKNDTTEILRESWIYEPEVKIPNNNFDPIPEIVKSIIIRKN